MSVDLLYADETYKIRGAIFPVYHQLGPGHRETICEKALKITFSKREVPFRDQVPLDGFGLKFGLVGNFHDLAPKTRIVRADR